MFFILTEKEVKKKTQSSH